MRAKLLGFGHAAPDRKVTNEMLTKFMDTSDEWIRQRTGILERRWARDGDSAIGECTNSDIAYRASKMAIEHAGLDGRDIDGIIYATITPDDDFKGSGCAVRKKLGLADNVPIFDVRNQCVGFLYALQVADSLIRSGSHRTLLVIGVELQSTGLDLTTRGRNTAVLFGDGAGAVIVVATDNPDLGIIDITLGTDGSHADSLGVKAPSFCNRPVLRSCDLEGEQLNVAVNMDGQHVFRMAVQKMPAALNYLLAKHKLSLSAVKLIIPHQANKRILDYIEQQLELPGRVYSNVAHYGNTTAASIPLALSEAIHTPPWRLAPNDLIALIAFGAGFSWGAALLRL